MDGSFSIPILSLFGVAVVPRFPFLELQVIIAC